MKIAELSSAPQAQRGREHLEHHGIKGMKWGVRKERATDGTVTATPKVNAGLRNKTKVKTEGGHAHPAHPDAVKAAAQKQVLKTSGPKALSNKDLQELINRANLERQAQQATASSGKKFVTNLTKQQGQQAVNREAATRVQEGVNKFKNR